MITSTVLYQGELICQLTHDRSGQRFHTDAPVDNNGKGSAFSPTDLAATSLATCMLTVMGIWARDREINIDGAMAKVVKHMGTNPRRIVRIEVEITMPDRQYDARTRSALTHIAETCPVAKSLHPDLQQDVTFIW